MKFKSHYFLEFEIILDFSGSIHLSKCRPALCNSEDDTIMEESTFNQRQRDNTLHRQPQKVATILRSRSCRDREVLSKLKFRPFHYLGHDFCECIEFTQYLITHKYTV